ncbi:MAG TPA: glycosyltransferase family 4 protein [Steroidobacteraceae bacterium]|nr:glycosyltransferase family 4 protein [Steroidobacteraceae bacterium]
MKVLIVTPYRACTGGVESVNRMVQAIFEADGHEVDYLTAEDGAGPAASVATRLAQRVVGLPAVTAARYRRAYHARYDLVLANGEFGWGIDHPNLVCVFHGSYRGLRDHLQAHLTPRQYASLSWQAQVQRLAASNKRVVAVSRFIAEILERQGIRVSRIIENCVDTETFRPALRRADARSYLFVGSYHRFAKGFDVLEELAAAGTNIDCVTDRPPGRGLGFLGPVPHAQMPQIYRRYRMLLFPSRFEAFGLAPLEALSCGLPVIMTRVGIGRSLATEVPEFVVDASGTRHLAAEFADRIAAIEARYAEFSAAARDYAVRAHSYARFAHDWRTVAREARGC